MKNQMKIQKRKSAQAEIVGITIVMVLIMLGIIFVIKYVILPEGYNIKQAYDKTQIAANFMDAALKTTTNCNTLTITELIQDCSEHYSSPSYLYQCPEDFNLNICIGGCSSCEYLNESMEYMLNNSLNQMPQVKYDLFICRWDEANSRCFGGSADIISNFAHNYCNSTTDRTVTYESKQQPIPTDVGNRVAQMYVC